MDAAPLGEHSELQAPWWCAHSPHKRTPAHKYYTLENIKL